MNDREQVEKEIKKELAQKLLDNWKELDSFCKKCDEGNEETYNWCDFSCMLMNEFSSVIHDLGFYINVNTDELEELNHEST